MECLASWKKELEKSKLCVVCQSILVNDDLDVPCPYCGADPDSGMVFMPMQPREVPLAFLERFAPGSSEELPT